ncbi:tRNA lysidine(34) synthetase TilS [Pelovirga terrestris]|uniref:tRNA(Ile)-lysidine synthase n=1 Tax=Pelovirga terrestris TaxID=2771352 RepID=A0A8J6UKQ4_9BACT|nr:tRNA lysidine(34) synthetase TilS [Pelovirga terrestris]MBD1399782.1 tRNA lysidine(34) synthetase TilS [Pelovirga terrestris]
MTGPCLEQAILKSLPDTVDSIVVAVSGGVDSVVLLHLLQRVAARCGLILRAVHLNHCMRPEADDDARFVEALCQQLNIPCHSESCNVAKLAQQGKISLEMAGRLARRRLLEQVAAETGAQLIALGHHRDDQLETLLLRLTRGTGISGLSGMAELDLPWWRPLLFCSRRQLLDYARRQSLSWREDASNLDPLFVRNRIRHQIVPRLKDINPQFAERMVVLSRQVAVEEDFWRYQIETHFPSIRVACDDGLRLQRSPLLGFHPALRLRLLRAALFEVRGHLHGIEAVHLQAIDDLLTGARSQAQLDLPGCWVARRYEHLWVRTAAPAMPPRYDVALQIPGEILLPDGRKLVATVVEQVEIETRHRVYVDQAVLDRPLTVRTWRPGDCFVPLGMTGHKRLKQLFSDLKIEKEERLRTPLVVAGETLLWVAGLQRSGFGVVTPLSVRPVRLELL